MPEKWILYQYQHLPLQAKIAMSQNRIREWYEHWNGQVCVSFSGGKDSTVLAHLVRGLYPDVPLVFANTGLEYPEIQAFARKMGAEFVRPKISFSEVISEYGYPIISKENAQAIYYARRILNFNSDDNTRNFGQESFRRRADITGERSSWEKNKKNVVWQGNDSPGISVPQNGEVLVKKEKTFYDRSKWLPLCRDGQFRISHYCCNVMKKGPMKAYQHKHHVYPYIGILTEESQLRENSWVKHGCNAFNSSTPVSLPLSFWTEQDILNFIYTKGIEIASVYGNIVGIDDSGFEYDPLPGVDCKLHCTKCQRTGCIFCGFGAHLDKGETRFQRLAKTHPKQYEYCIGGGQWVDNPSYDPTIPKMDGNWQNWNPKKIWVPSKKGLGMGHVFDECNAIYGKDFIRYD